MALSYLKTVRVLIIGDIHYPDLMKVSDIDKKDPQFPNALNSLVEPSRAKAVMQEIAIVRERDPIDATVILGDLTSRADFDGYKACAKYLSDSLKWPAMRRPPANDPLIHIVPGNHDIDRAAVSTNNQYRKIKNILARFGLNVLPLAAPRNSKIKNLSLWSLNSCVGCGTQRGMTSNASLAALKKEFSRIDTLTAETEGLDTPAFDESHIATVVTEVRRMPKDEFPMVIAHHNLLPQAVIREALYTELINGGSFRSRLLAIDRPLLYIHGHTHSDPTELIAMPRHENSRLICHSATEFSKGFDVINIHSSAAGIPIGCTVERYRYLDGHFDRTATFIPLYSSIGGTGPLGAPAIKLLKLLRAQSESIDSILELWLSTYNTRPKKRTIISGLEELAWLHLAKIEDRSVDPELWRTRRYRNE